MIYLPLLKIKQRFENGRLTQEMFNNHILIEVKKMLTKLTKEQKSLHKTELDNDKILVLLRACNSYKDVYSSLELKASEKTMESLTALGLFEYDGNVWKSKFNKQLMYNVLLNKAKNEAIKIMEDDNND